MMDELFSVWWFDPDGRAYAEASFVDAKSAVAKAKSLTTRPATALGIITRIIIVDGGDNTVFEWKNGEGVTFPPRGA